MGIGKIIGEECERQGLSLRQLSIKADVPYSTLYSAVKRDSNGIDATTLKKIAKALNLYSLYIYTVNQSMYDSLTPYLRTLRGEGAGIAASVEQGDTPHGSTLTAAPDSAAGKAANLAHLMGRISAGDIPDAAEAAPAQVEQLLQDFNKLNPAGREKALERVHELTEVPRYTSPAVTPAPASTAESTQAAPQSSAVNTDTPKGD